MSNQHDDELKENIREHYEAELESAVVELEFDLTKALGALAEIRYFTDKLVH